MVQEFGIKEFQFYDWFADYSHPTMGNIWTDPWLHQRQICRSSLIIYLDEIHKQGGRAWAYVQSVAAEETTWADPSKQIYPLIDANNVWYWHEGKFPCYFLNAAWADHMVQTWAPEIKAMGFDGIHWDSLGPIAGDYTAETNGTQAFLQETKKALAPYGLKQTFNFVNLSWWSNEVLSNLEFPYAEVWNMTLETNYYTKVAKIIFGQLGAVMAFYPNADVPQGWTNSQVLIARFQQAQKFHVAYLAIGDGNRRVTGAYLPDTQPLSDAETEALKIPNGTAKPKPGQ